MPTFDIAGLSATERLDLIAKLWDSLNEAAPLTDAQKIELDRRLAQADTATARPWSEVRAELAARR